MNHFYTIDEIRQAENAALAVTPVGALMEKAGEAAAQLAISLLPPAHEKAPILVLAGPGNNGGDALQTAAILANQGLSVTVLLVTGKQNASPEASLARKNAINSPIQWEDALSFSKAMDSIREKSWSLVIDGMFGIGLREGLSGNRGTLIEYVNTLECPVLALDVPSGLNANTGTLVGKEKLAIRATHTMTFVGHKPGLLTGMGKDYAGTVFLAALDVDAQHFPVNSQWLNDPELFAHCFKKRLQNSHKGSFGRVAIVGGGDGMHGAPVLAARAALHCGAGLCFAVFPEDPPTYDPVQPELMFRAAHRVDYSNTVTAIGPGLGQSRLARQVLRQVLDYRMPLILDADALNLLAHDTALRQFYADQQITALMTPHPLEAARLLDTGIETVQNDRLGAARALAEQYQATVILKGSGTVIAAPDGRQAINTTGNPVLATAGTGDVLTGVCAALVAQDWPFWEAALGAVWLHGKAADQLAAQGMGPVGVTAQEFIPEIRRELNLLMRQYTE